LARKSQETVRATVSVGKWEPNMTKEWKGANLGLEGGVVVRILRRGPTGGGGGFEGGEDNLGELLGDSVDILKGRVCLKKSGEEG
jgi:hypothetical protein